MKPKGGSNVLVPSEDGQEEARVNEKEKTNRITVFSCPTIYDGKTVASQNLWLISPLEDILPNIILDTFR